MIPVVQSICASGGELGPDGKPQTPGDCVRACIASILERPLLDVPHFVAGEVKNDNGQTLDWYSGLNLWLEREGYACRAMHRSFFKQLDCQMAWRQEIDRAGLYSPHNMLWMYDARDAPPWHPGFWIASVISENFEGTTHAIVMRGCEVAHDPSPRPRRTPYQYVGEMRFVVEDAAVCRRIERPALMARAA